MRSSDNPEWDVRGHMVIACDEASDQFEFRARCYPDGRGLVDVDGVTYPVPKDMTAVEYLRMMFSRKLRPTGLRQVVGAMVAMMILGLIAQST